MMSCVESTKVIQMNYLQNRNRLTDMMHKLVVTKGKGGGGRINWEFGINRYILLYVK